MNAPRPDPAEPARWLAFAQEDLAYGEMGLASFPRAAIWNLQQAAEKALKAALLQAGQEIPRTHDIPFLLTQLQAVIPDANALHQAALRLAEISPAMRYPADLPELSQEDVRQIAAAARAIVEWTVARVR